MKSRVYSYAVGLVIAHTAITSTSAAQQRHGLTIEPQAGAWFLTGSGSGVSNSPAPYIGARVSYPSGERLRWTGGIAYLWRDQARTVRTEAVDGRIRTDVYGVTYIPITAGIEYALTQGPTRLSVGFEGGAIRTRQPLLHSDGPPPFAGTPPTRVEVGAVAIPTISLGRQLGNRLVLRGDARMLIGGASAGGVPMFGAGLGWQL